MQKQDEFKRPIFTFQARLNLDADQAAKLDAYAAIYGRAQRSLFEAMQKGKSIDDLKRRVV
jgi:hypothetical protein